MKAINASVVVLLLAGSLNAACREGFVPSDVEGVCQAKGTSVTDPAIVSDEKPSHHPQPAYQRGEVTIVEAPNLEAEDRKRSQEIRDANAEGKKRAKIK